MNQLHELTNVPMIIPTIMIPLTLISVGLSVVATFVAGLFGIQLKNEGPKKLLEVLLKPRVLVAGVLMNLAIWGGVKGWAWVKNYPRFLLTLQRESDKNKKSSDKIYDDQSLLNNSYQTKKVLFEAPLDSLSQIWKFKADGGIFSTAVVSANSIFIGDRNGYISELDYKSGQLIRKFYIGNPTGGRLTIWKGALYSGEGEHYLHHARVYKFDLKTGALVGTYSSKGHIEGQAVAARYDNQDLLFVVAGSDGLHAVDPATMKAVWKANYGHSDAAVAIEDNRVYLGTGCEKDDGTKNKSYAVALDFKSGAELWKHELPASNWMAPTIIGESVCYVTGELYFPSERGHLACFNKKTGDYAQAFNFSEPLAADPLVLDGDLVVSTLKGQMCRLDMNKVERKWCMSAHTTGYGYSAPAYDSKINSIVYSSNDKGVFVIDPDTGAIRLNWNPSEGEGLWKKTYATAKITSDLWIVSDFDSSVRALRPLFKTRLRDQALNETSNKSKKVWSN